MWRVLVILMVDGLDVLYTEDDKQAWDWIFDFREDVFKALENARALKVIGKWLEAKVIVNVNQQQQQLLDDYIGSANLAQWFIVSDFEFTDEKLEAFDVCQVKIEAASGHSCPRCWNITPSTREDHLCDRCHGVLNQ